jgi:biopolymer transport protein ExbD
VPVNTPSSVAAKVAPETNVVMISLNKDGKVFLSTGDSKNDKDKKAQIIRSVNSHKNLGLSDAEIAALVRAPFIGTPLAQLKQQARLATDQMTGESLPGIYVKDSTNNEMLEWMRGVADAYAGMKPNLLLKGDNVAKYPSFRNIIDAFRKNEFFKFQMVTNPESVPMGTDLFRVGVREE